MKTSYPGSNKYLNQNIFSEINIKDEKCHADTMLSDVTNFDDLIMIAQFPASQSAIKAWNLLSQWLKLTKLS